MTGSDCHNLQRTSAGKGMTTMVSMMEQVGDQLAQAMCDTAAIMSSMNLTATHPCPANADGNSSISIAMALIKVNEGLSDKEIADIAECMTTNLTITAMYILMSNKTAHSRYINKRVDDYHGYEADK
jgi:hypothetical protein